MGFCHTPNDKVLGQVVINVDVDLPSGCHGLHTDEAVPILVGRSAHMMMGMVVMFHRHFERKARRTTA